MEEKKFSNYTQEEKEILLMHWFHYYGKDIYSLAEAEEVYKAILANADSVKDAAVVAYVAGEGSAQLLRAMRYGTLDSHLRAVSELGKSGDVASIYEKAEELFISEIVETYNNPEASIPLTDEEILKSVIELYGDGEVEILNVDVNEKFGDLTDKKKLTAEEVNEVYRRCLLTDTEVNELSEPMTPFVLGEGVKGIQVFSASRLAENRAKITEMIAELPSIDEGVSFMNLCEDKQGRQWTDLQRTVDELLQLGTATGEVFYLLPRDVWDMLPGGMPIIMRNEKASEKALTTNEPQEYKKVRNCRDRFYQPSKETTE